MVEPADVSSVVVGDILPVRPVTEDLLKTREGTKRVTGSEVIFEIHVVVVVDRHPLAVEIDV
jgi:hypothetical protein